MLDGKVAIVTGAGHGIGRGHALELARHGAKVVVNDLGSSVSGEGTSRDADLTVDIITERGGEAVGNYENVADFEGAGRMVAQAVDTYGQLDILVNNAGIVRDSAIWNMSEADFDAVIAVHLKGAWAPSKHAAVHWRERNKATGGPVGGRIINTTSGAGLTGNFGQTNYATAKAGISSMTQTLSLELYKMGVTVNCVGPAAATRITATMPGAPDVIEADEVPEGEWNRMDPSVSSPLVAWLASDEAAHVTGQTIRAVAEDIIWMTPWSNGPTINNGGKRWDATSPGYQVGDRRLRNPRSGPPLLIDHVPTNAEVLSAMLSRCRGPSGTRRALGITRSPCRSMTTTSPFCWPTPTDASTVDGERPFSTNRSSTLLPAGRGRPIR